MAADLLGAVEASFALRRTPAGALEGPNVPLEGYGRLFGGQLLAQALGAAATVTDHKAPRSLHLAFLAEGSPDQPVSWTVDPLQSGRTFSACSVLGRQSERLLVAGLASLHAAEPGLDHQLDAPLVERPEHLRPITPTGAMPLEMRVAGGVPLSGPDVGPPELAVWMRAPRALSDPGPLAHHQLLAYCSDATMMAVAMRPHPGVGFGEASLAASAVTSHAVSFHRPFQMDGWMLFVQHSPSAFGARAYVRGDWYDAAGLLVASCTQESMIRTMPGDAA